MKDFYDIITLYESDEINSKALRFKNQVEDFFKFNPILYKSQPPIIHTIKSRLKSKESLIDKLNRKKAENILISVENFTEKITDLIGVRILHIYLEQFPSIHEQIMNQVNNGEWEFYEPPKAYSWDDDAIILYENLDIRTQKKNQYTSVHYVVRVKNNDPKPIYCEIQVRTLFEEIWGEIDHTINYPHKTKSIACEEQIKSLSKMIMTGRSMVDSIFKSYHEHLYLNPSNEVCKSETNNGLHLKEYTEVITENKNLTSSEYCEYSSYSLADKYFPLYQNDTLTKIISNLKIHNWYVQNPAIDLLLEENLNIYPETLENSEKIFLLGRNIYQSACGDATNSIAFINNLNLYFSKYSDFVIQNLYSGILYEIYFNSSNSLRKSSKSNFINEIFKLETNPRLQKSINFIRKSLNPYKKHFFILPNSITPENASVEILTDTRYTEEFNSKKEINEVKSIKLNNQELITLGNIAKVLNTYEDLDELLMTLSHLYTIPKYKLNIITPKTNLKNLFIPLPKGLLIKI